MTGRTFRSQVDTTGLNGFMDALGDAVADAVRPAAYNGGKVIVDAAKLNVSRIPVLTGNLRDAIYIKHIDEVATPGKFSRYSISWNHIKAPHGRLVEWGYKQRYAVYVNKQGLWKTAIRPEKRGTKPPKRSAGQAALDAYYVLRKNGPIQTKAYQFLTNAGRDSSGKARQAVIDTFINAVEGVK